MSYNSDWTFKCFLCHLFNTIEPQKRPFGASTVWFVVWENDNRVRQGDQ